ncbi:MAG: hypothetical protein K8H89_08915 [Flavobacteriales bacterium]|jgi:hypothetical protein|nr:hypothetical protein [Flavobacteriales bacterium]MCB0758926.1 hypothetical protein [Flavobacteriales bacterium]
MDYRSALLHDPSKTNIQRVADHIGKQPKRFALLVDLVLHGTDREAQLASWPMSIACEAHPELGTPWVKKMLDVLDRPMHPGVHRNVIRALQFCPLPKPLHGRITERVFSIIPDPAQPIASRAFSITVAMRMVGQYPGLTSEFRLLLEDALRKDPGPAVRSRSSKALKLLARQEFIDPTTTW